MHSISVAHEDCWSAWRMEHLAFSSFHHCRITHLGVDLERLPFPACQVGFFPWQTLFAQAWEVPSIFFDQFGLMVLFWLARKSFPVVVNRNSFLSNTPIFYWCFVSSYKHWFSLKTWVLLCLENTSFSTFLWYGLIYSLLILKGEATLLTQFVKPTVNILCWICFLLFLVSWNSLLHHMMSTRAGAL